MIQKAQGNANKWEQEVQRKEMSIRCWVTRFPDVQDIVGNNAKRNDNTLTNFNSIDPRQDVDCISAKNTQKCHISIIKPAYKSNLKTRKDELRKYQGL